MAERFPIEAMCQIKVEKPMTNFTLYTMKFFGFRETDGIKSLDVFLLLFTYDK